jgi:mRNA interferase MazF
VIHEGQVVLFRFPQTDQAAGKLRPAVVLRRLPGPYDDWLICMVSSQLNHATPRFDEVMAETDADFAVSGLKTASVIRICRIAVVDRKVLLGAVGEISATRLERVRRTLSQWIGGA